MRNDWLDKYEDGGEYLGTTNKGRNYSPAWGGQFQDGGSLPKAQKGKTLRPIVINSKLNRAEKDSAILYNMGITAQKQYKLNPNITTKQLSDIYDTPETNAAYVRLGKLNKKSPDQKQMGKPVPITDYNGMRNPVFIPFGFTKPVGTSKPKPEKKKPVVNNVYKVTKAELLKSDRTAFNPQITQLQNQSINLPTIQNLPYRVEYYDGDINGMTHKNFIDEKAGSEFMKELQNRSYGIPYGVQAYYENTPKKENGGWLSKYDEGGEISPNCDTNALYHPITNPCGYKVKLTPGLLENTTQQITQLYNSSNFREQPLANSNSYIQQQQQQKINNTKRVEDNNLKNKILNQPQLKQTKEETPYERERRTALNSSYVGSNQYAALDDNGNITNRFAGRDITGKVYDSKANRQERMKPLIAAGAIAAGATGLPAVVSAASPYVAATSAALNAPLLGTIGTQYGAGALTAQNLIGLGFGLTGASNLGSDINSGYYNSDAPLLEKIERGLITGMDMAFSPGVFKALGMGYGSTNVASSVDDVGKTINAYPVTLTTPNSGYKFPKVSPIAKPHDHTKALNDYLELGWTMDELKTSKKYLFNPLSDLIEKDINYIAKQNIDNFFKNNNVDVSKLPQSQMVDSKVGYDYVLPEGITHDMLNEYARLHHKEFPISEEFKQVGEAIKRLNPDAQINPLSSHSIHGVASNIHPNDNGFKRNLLASSVDDVVDLNKPVKASFLNPLKILDAISPRLPAPTIILGMEDDVINHSPLNFITGYGKKLAEPKFSYPTNSGNTEITAYRKFGNSLDDVINSKTFKPEGGFRMGAKQIQTEGNWAEAGIANENYKGVFAAGMNPRVEGTNIKLQRWNERNGVVGMTKQGNPAIPITDPGLNFHRRLPFSNRYVPIDKQKLIDNKFQLATQLPIVQSLIEKYGIAAAYALTFGYLVNGKEGAIENLKTVNKYSIDPIKNWSKKAWDELKNTLQEKKYGGIIKDNRGQWDHPGKITRIKGGNITMKPDPKTGKALTEPLLGISNTGERKMMYPGQDYQFEDDTEYVTEYPVAKNGVRQEQKGLQNLDDLLNFTNYNKPQPGGWLNKYN